jgi:RNA polymerase sigma factor (sigma-70 family)
MNKRDQGLCREAIDEDKVPAYDEVLHYVYRFPGRQRGFTEEDAAGFLLTFYPRIQKLIRKYRPMGSSFEAYLKSTLRWQLRSYAARKRNSKIRLSVEASEEVACEIHELPSDFVPANPAFHSRPHVSGSRGVTAPDPRNRHHPIVRNPPARTPSVPLSPSLLPSQGGLTPGEAQRVLFMALKAADRLNEDECRSLARTLGCDPDWIVHVWLTLRRRCDENLQRRAAARATRDRAWFKIRCLQTRLVETLEPTDRELCEKKLAEWRKRFETARGKVTSIPSTPTHKEIAECLGVPKGTVDSSIFRIRKELDDPAYIRRLVSIFDPP